ncbi:MAG: hypothetical protein VX300_05065, partial [Acidobacteriota bacterium]|nr:hypothetical protein [Acidobacteriota bacterium]
MSLLDQIESFVPLKTPAPKISFFVVLLLTLGVAVFATQSDEFVASDAANDWSWFRGPTGNGVADTFNLPSEVGPDTNVIWATQLPPGHSSPILSEGKIFLTGVVEDDLQTIAL